MSNLSEHTPHYIPSAGRLRKAALFLVILLSITHLSYSAEKITTQKPTAVILMYHRFDDNRYPSTNTSLYEFRAHIQLIRNLDRPIVPLTEIVEGLNNGRVIPENATAITIDDAFRSVYDVTWPYLRDNNIPFTLFVATEPVAQGQTDYMTPEHLQEMASHPGVTIASHGHTHNSLAFAGANALNLELKTADTLLSEWLGTPSPRIFAFPYGEAGSAALTAVETFGFTAAFGQHSGAAGKYQDRFYLPRFPMSGNFTTENRLREALSTLPFPHKDFAPANPAISKNNPPKFIEFTLIEELTPDRLNCFSGGANLDIKSDGNRVQIVLPLTSEPPRWRINCTHPAPGGRWYWLGWQAAIDAEVR